MERLCWIGGPRLAKWSPFSVSFIWENTPEKSPKVKNTTAIVVIIRSFDQLSLKLMHLAGDLTGGNAECFVEQFHYVRWRNLRFKLIVSPW